MRLQTRLFNWCKHAFGVPAATDMDDRVWRVLEETLELVQAVGLSEERVHRKVANVFSKPVGEINQEIAGVLNTLLITAEARGIDALQAGEIELQRAWEKIELIKAKNLSGEKFPVRD